MRNLRKALEQVTQSLPRHLHLSTHNILHGHVEQSPPCPTRIAWLIDRFLLFAGLALLVYLAVVIAKGGFGYIHLLPLASAVAFLGSLLFPANLKASIILLATSVFFSLYMMEAFLSVYLPAVGASWVDVYGRTSDINWSRDLVDRRDEEAAQSGVAFDTRPRLEVIHDLEKHHLEGYPPTSGIWSVEAEGGRL